MAYGRFFEDEDELERRRREDELASLTVSSPDAWIEQQAGRNPTWMRRQPDMAFSVAEAEGAPDMTIGLDEAEDRDPFARSVTPLLAAGGQPDMTFSVEETERPDMVFSVAEAEGRREPVYQASTMPRGLGALGGPARDPALDSGWRQAELGALSRSGYGGEQSYGLGEGLRDFAPMAIGGALDILLNKGRGLGVLTAGGMQALSMERARRQASERQAGEFALDARRQRGDDRAAELRAGESELGWANLGERMRTNARLEEMQRYNIDPRHPQALAMLEHVKRQTGVDQGGLSTKQQGQAMPLAGRVQELELAPQRARAVTQAELDVKHEMAPRTAQDEAMRGNVVEEGTRDAKLTTAGAERDLKNPAIDGGGAPILPQGIRDTNGKFAVLAQRNPDEAMRRVNTVQDMAKLVGITHELVKIRAAIDAIPLKGRTRNNPELATLLGQWEENEGAYQAEYFKAQDRGAPQAYEDKRFQGQIGAPMTWEDAAGKPLEAVKSALTNQAAMLEGRLAALQQRRAAIIEATFGPQGGGAAAPGGRPNYGPDASRPSNLGVTGGRRVSDTPAIPAMAPPAGTSAPRAIPRPDGSFDIDGETYTEDEVQRLIRKGLVQP